MEESQKLNSWKERLAEAWARRDQWMPPREQVIAWGGLVFVFIFTYWTTLGWYRRAWSAPEYGHAPFVPVFSFFLLWYRRDMLPALKFEGNFAWGLGLFGVWALVRWAGAYFNYEWFDPFSVIPAAAAVTVFVGGWSAVQWAWPSLTFLIFMVPLPGAVSAWLSQPLQQVGTVTSVYIIQVLGVPAVVQGGQGNVIQLTEGTLGVAEACSGLRMLMLFFAVCVGAAFVMRASLWEKLVIIVSAIPIALLSNILRITVTAVLYEVAHRWPSILSTETADHVFHDLAGWLMMPVALALLWAEVALISKLMIEGPPEEPLSFGAPAAPAARKPEVSSQAGN